MKRFKIGNKVVMVDTPVNKQHYIYRKLIGKVGTFLGVKDEELIKVEFDGKLEVIYPKRVRLFLVAQTELYEALNGEL